MLEDGIILVLCQQNFDSVLRNFDLTCNFNFNLQHSHNTKYICGYIYAEGKNCYGNDMNVQCNVSFAKGSFTFLSFIKSVLVARKLLWKHNLEVYIHTYIQPL